MSLLSQSSLSKNLYLEGGAALSFLFGIKREFSGDLDFTFSYRRAIQALNQEFPAFLVSLENKERLSYFLNSKEKRFTIFKDRMKIFHLDYEIVDDKFFSWIEVSFTFKGKNFKIRTHTLEDIFAEKICGLLDPKRVEYKDLLDLKSIFPRINWITAQRSLLSKIQFKFDLSKQDNFQNLLENKKALFLREIDCAQGTHFLKLWQDDLSIIESILARIK